jgi:hypothetical protein
METMPKIPNYISNYVDNSINSAVDRVLVHVDKRFNEFHTLIVKEFKHHTGAILNEFDSKLKTVGEYLDTKPDREEVRQIIQEEKDGFHR